MTHSSTDHQQTLFATKINVVETLSVSADPESQAEPSLTTEITRDDLLTQLLESMVHGRRWERQLLVGATDAELAVAFGHAWVGGQTFNAQFQVDREPALRCVDKNGEEILTLSADELAPRVRALTSIPERPEPEEVTRRLEARLEEERKRARAELFTAAQSMLKDKARKKDQGFTYLVVDMLFVPGCLTERVERQTIENITAFLLVREWTAADATQTALDLVKRARCTWTSTEGYWLQNSKRTSASQGGGK